MKKRDKLLLYLGGGFIVLMLGAVILWNIAGSSNETSSSVSVNLPNYILNSDDEQQIQEFVKYFVSLYNSYGYGYLSNLSALKDQQSLQMQEKTSKLIDELNKTLQPGDSVRTEVDLQTFSYLYPEASHLVIKVEGVVTAKQEGSASQYRIFTQLDLVRINKKWLVNDIKITKK